MGVAEADDGASGEHFAGGITTEQKKDYKGRQEWQRSYHGVRGSVIAEVER